MSTVRATAGIEASTTSAIAEVHAEQAVTQGTERMPVSMTVNGQTCTMMVEPRTTLLDALREELVLTGTKKGCDRGECGACTVHVEGRRFLSCMTLAAMQEGKRITTIEGLEGDGDLHPVQAAFIEHDGFQCGFCTSGQIMSGVAMIEEARAGWPSSATADVRRPFTLADLSNAEIRERMSGNLCRCACYPNMINAVAEAAGGELNPLSSAYRYERDRPGRASKREDERHHEQARIITNLLRRSRRCGCKSDYLTGAESDWDRC
jgi:xanthine dehydrogenase YagT iron-sulfur-binding subunit